MKRNQIKEVSQKLLPELRKLLVERQKNLLQLKMEAKSGKIKDIRAISKARDDLARIATMIRQKELEVSNK